MSYNGSVIVKRFYKFLSKMAILFFYVVTIACECTIYRAGSMLKMSDSIFVMHRNAQRINNNLVIMTTVHVQEHNSIHHDLLTLREFRSNLGFV